MPDFVKKEKIPYPVAIDTEGKTVDAFEVDSLPDYYVIDRSGKLRVADLANAELDRVIELLLAEKPPETAQDNRDDFRRERRGENAAWKDALESRTPPPLRVSGWMNTGGEALKLRDLTGSVVVLQFWGSW